MPTPSSLPREWNIFYPSGTVSLYSPSYHRMSYRRLQDWRCLWCRTTVHTQCRPKISPACPLGPARVSVVPPTALHSIQDEAWEAVRPQASSPLLVFVNSKSGTHHPTHMPLGLRLNLPSTLAFFFWLLCRW